MPLRRSVRQAPPPKLELRGRLERQSLRALGATGGPNRRVGLGPKVRLDGQTLDAPVQAMLGLRSRLRYPAWHEQPVDDARRTMRHEALVAAGRPIAVASADDLEVDGATGPLPARLYRPGGARNPALTWQPRTDRLPLLLFFHGGGFVLGDRDSHDAVCRMLCSAAGILVLSVEYRLAPEHPWPAAPDDAAAAWWWTVDHADELGADLERLAIGGDSAGGNLTAITAQVAAAGRGREDDPRPAAQLLLYPAVDWTREYASRDLFGHGFYLEDASMDWCERHYLGPAGAVDLADPRISPITGELRGLAPALVVTAGFDPLRDQGEAYAAALRQAGTPAVCRRMPDLIHGFANTPGVGRRSREAMLEVSSLLRGMLEIEPAVRARGESASAAGTAPEGVGAAV
ncbi:alpha/beta hydrolase [Patulibacter minatonensis]|uniref:alpha/beta hydrolase n=1 Tax=Patulibacter minatonensis TaxID=298163 RepID=UPI00068845BC|nr:alpha/beta hydrolase [Patulibacter minatonensis]